MTASEYLAGQRVNIELLLWINDKNILHYGVRLRPWKQETRIGAMVLAQGLSVDDAIKNAARELYNGKWERLDYAARPWLVRQPEMVDGDPATVPDFMAPEMPQEGRKEVASIDTRRNGKTVS